MFLARFSALCILIIKITAVPPEECFANFRWDDCGKPPEPVIYYWKPGSRCEVGTWRGCVPNPNMFKNEYECVETCVYNVNRNELRQENLEKIMKPADSVKLMEIDIEKENVGLNETETTSLIDSGFSTTTVANDLVLNKTKLVANKAKDSDVALASVVTLVPDEMSSSNTTTVPVYNVTLMASDQMLTSNVDGEILAFNDSAVHDESTSLVSDKPSASNENLVANETISSNNSYVPNELVGFNKTDVHEDEASKKEKIDNKTEEVDKPKGRSRLATYLKGE